MRRQYSSLCFSFEPSLDNSPRGSQVVGAGRGPLVRASLKAAAETGRRIRVFAVEKNPNAVVTLQNLVASEGYAAHKPHKPH